jgi:hypothetical protein
LYRYFVTSLVSFAVITLCVASQRVFIVVYFVTDLVRKLLDTPLYLPTRVSGNQQELGTGNLIIIAMWT